MAAADIEVEIDDASALQVLLKGVLPANAQVVLDSPQTTTCPSAPRAGSA